MKLLVAFGMMFGIWWFSQRRNTNILSTREARELLGLKTGASEAEILTAHRRLIQRVHPDAGGSAALAGRVNAARDLLVTELNRKRVKAS